MNIDGKHVYPRASVGICMADGNVNTYDAEELLRNADVAMYMAKRDSKGSYRLFEPAMHERVLERLELQAELQRAIEHRQLRAALPARRAARREPSELRRRSTAPLESPGTRGRAAASVHSAGRGDGLDRPDRTLGAARGLPAGRDPPSAFPPARPAHDQRQPLREATAVGVDRARRRAKRSRSAGSIRRRWYWRSPRR